MVTLQTRKLRLKVESLLIDFGIKNATVVAENDEGVYLIEQSDLFGNMYYIASYNGKRTVKIVLQTNSSSEANLAFIGI